MVAVDAVSFTLLQDQLQSVLATLWEREASIIRLLLRRVMVVLAVYVAFIAVLGL